MKRDIKWLSQWIEEYESEVIEERKDELKGIVRAHSHGEQLAIKRIKQKIDQLDEPEVKQLDREIRKLESYNDKLIRDNNQLINELYNQEVLSQDWIDEHAKAVAYDGIPDQTEVVYVDELENLLVPKQEVTEEQVMHWLDNNDFYCHATAETVLENAVDKGELGYYGTKYSVVEKPVIPKYVADWIEEERGTMSNWKLPNRFISDSKYKKDHRRYKWSQVEGNMDNFMSALINGYEVEKEPLYYVMQDGVVILSKTGEDYHPYKSHWIGMVTNEEYIKNNPNEVRFTEQEIKDFDGRFWPFAVPVEKVAE